jgi:hypothetical protein
MKSLLNIPNELLTGIDMINTLFGGIAEPNVKLQQFNTFRQINISIPSIELDSVKIEIINNVLMIYYFIPLRSQNENHNYPKVIYKKIVPYFVDRDAIEATIEDDEVVVKLPFNELAGGFKRQITISK